MFVVEYVAKPLVVGVNAPASDALARGTTSFQSFASVLNDYLKDNKKLAIAMCRRL